MINIREPRTSDKIYIIAFALSFLIIGFSLRGYVDRLIEDRNVHYDNDTSFQASLGEWTMFYYPHGCLECEDEWIIVGKLKSEEECIRQIEFNDRTWGIGNNEPKAECGKNCKSDEDFDGYICDITKDY